MDTNQQHDHHRILEAASFAAERHARQRRKGVNADPYVNHLLEVATAVARALDQPDTNLLIAALLHDAVEDAGVTREEIEEKFGSDVATLVMEVTDDKSLPKAERKRMQVESAPKKSQRAQMIKLADKASNLRGILSSPPSDWDHERKIAYFEWAREVVDALPAPNPTLMEEFEQAYAMRDSIQP